MSAKTAEMVSFSRGERFRRGVGSMGERGEAAATARSDGTVIRQERAERTREAVIRAAARVFEREGYVGALLAEISALAGVTKGALYFHFASKRHLALAVVDEAGRALEAVKSPVLSWIGVEPGLQLVIDLTHAVLPAVAASQVLRAGLRLGADGDLFPDGAGGLRIDWPGLIDQVLAAPGDGEQPCALDPHAPLGALLNGLELVYRARPDQVGDDALTEVWGLLLPGLTPGSAARYRPAGGPALSRAGATRPPGATPGSS